MGAFTGIKSTFRRLGDSDWFAEEMIRSYDIEERVGATWYRRNTLELLQLV